MVNRGSRERKCEKTIFRESGVERERKAIWRYGWCCRVVEKMVKWRRVGGQGGGSGGVRFLE